MSYPMHPRPVKVGDMGGYGFEEYSPETGAHSGNTVMSLNHVCVVVCLI